MVRLTLLMLCGALLLSAPISAQQPARLTLTREMTINGTDEDLVPIRGIAVDATGNIAVTQWQDGALRFYSASGAPLGKVGRKGGGPGEFQAMSQLGWIADTLWVYDGIQHRFTLLSPARKVLRTVPVPIPAKPPASDAGSMPNFPFVFPKALYADGRILAQVGVGISSTYEPPEEYKNQSTYARLLPDGTIELVIARVKSTAKGIEAREGGKFIGNASLPFSSHTMEAAAPDGSRLAIAHASIEGPDAGTFSVTLLNATGETVFSRRYPFRKQPIPKHAGDSTIEAGYAFLRKGGGSGPQLAALYKREAKVPAMYPPLRDLIVGKDGSIWIGMRPEGKQRLYYRITSKGVLAGELILPNNATIAAADASRIWALEADEDDVQSVVRYRWSAPSPAGTRVRQ
jgi:hypothetical protein